MRLNISILVILGLLLLVNIGFSGTITGGRFGNITCGGTIDSANVTAQGSSNFTLALPDYTNVSALTTQMINNVTDAPVATCVRITTSNIILDLNGSVIQLINAATTPANPMIGIDITNGSNNITIINGFINVSSGTAILTTTINYEGIKINSSANITIRNVTFNPFSGNGIRLITSAFPINITNVSNTMGFILIDSVNISNVTTAGILLNNASNVTLINSWFAAGGPGTWLSSVPAISVINQSAASWFSVNTTVFNSSLNNNNISIFSYGNFTVLLPSIKPAGNDPNGVSSTQTFLSKMINITVSSTDVTLMNLTFWFSSSEISPFNSNQLSIFRNPISNGWIGPLTSTVGSNSITATNILSSNVFALYGYAPPAQSSGGGSPPAPACVDITKTCPDGSKIITDKCNQYAYLQPTGATCSIGMLDVKNSAICPNNDLLVTVTSNSTPVSNANVYLSPNCQVYLPTTELGVTKVTDKNGQVTFQSLNSGQYCLKATANGYTDNSQTITYGTDNLQCKLLDLNVGTSVSCPSGDLVIIVSDTNPISGASVELNQFSNNICDPNTKVTKTTGNDGKAVFSASKGQYCVKATKQGYNDNKLNINYDACPTQNQINNTGNNTNIIVKGNETGPAPVYDLVTDPQTKVGKEQFATATKDGAACIQCTVVMKKPDGKETKFLTDQKGQIKISFPDKGTYQLTLLTSAGEIAKKKTVDVALNLQAPEENKKSVGIFDNPAIQSGLGIIVVILVLAGVYLWWRGRDSGGSSEKKSYKKEKYSAYKE